MIARYGKDDEKKRTVEQVFSILQIGKFLIATLANVLSETCAEARKLSALIHFLERNFRIQIHFTGFFIKLMHEERKKERKFY